MIYFSIFHPFCLSLYPYPTPYNAITLYTFYTFRIFHLKHSHIPLLYITSTPTIPNQTIIDFIIFPLLFTWKACLQLANDTLLLNCYYQLLSRFIYGFLVRVHQSFMYAFALTENSVGFFFWSLFRLTVWNRRCFLIEKFT